MPWMRTLGWWLAATGVSASAGCGRSKCDLPKLHALTKSIRASEPQEAADQVAQGLGQACELPPALAGFFAASEVTRLPQSEQLSGLPGNQRFADVLALTCPKSAREDVAAAAPEAKLSVAYDRCEFESLGLVDKAAWLATNPSWPDPFIAYRWLQDQGASEAAARPLARAMIAHDRRHWAEQGQQLPEVDFALPPIPNDVADPIYLNNTALLYRGNKLASLRRDGLFTASAVKGMQVKLLARDLALSAQRGLQVVVSDRRVSAVAIQQVLHTAQQAGFGPFGLVVKTGPQTFGMLPVSPVQARHPLDTTAGKGLAVDVELLEDAVHVRASNNQSKLQTFPVDDFGNWASSIRSLFPGQMAATVVPVGNAAYGDLAKVLAELRGPCESDAAGTTCLRPGVVVTNTRAANDQLIVQADGKVEFRGRLQDRKQLCKSLASAVASRGPEALQVVVIADQNTPYSQVVEVLDTARECGVTKMSISVQPPN